MWPSGLSSETPVLRTQVPHCASVLSESRNLSKSCLDVASRTQDPPFPTVPKGHYSAPNEASQRPVPWCAYCLSYPTPPGKSLVPSWEVLALHCDPAKSSHLSVASAGMLPALLAPLLDSRASPRLKFKAPGNTFCLAF